MSLTDGDALVLSEIMKSGKEGRTWTQLLSLRSPRALARALSHLQKRSLIHRGAERRYFSDAGSPDALLMNRVREFIPTAGVEWIHTALLLAAPSLLMTPQGKQALESLRSNLKFFEELGSVRLQLRDLYLEARLSQYSKADHAAVEGYMRKLNEYFLLSTMPIPNQKVATMLASRTPSMFVTLEDEEFGIEDLIKNAPPQDWERPEWKIKRIDELKRELHRNSRARRLFARGPILDAKGSTPGMLLVIPIEGFGGGLRLLSLINQKLPLTVTKGQPAGAPAEA